MNTTKEETPEDGNQRRKSIGSLNGGSGGLTGKTRRYSIGIPNSRKSIGEEGNIVPNYLRASTGSCHDFCKYGKKHEHAKSSIPIKFKRSTAVNKEKVTKTVVPVERKKTTTVTKTQTPVEFESTKNDVSFISKKPQVLKRVLSTNGKPKENELKFGQRSTSAGSNGGIKKKDIRTVKKTGITPKDVKKVVAKGTPIESQSPKASFSKAMKYKNIKKVSPLKDQNRTQKTQIESETKSETIEFDYIHETVGIIDSPPFPSTELINNPVSSNGSEKDSMITHSVYESPKLFPEKELLEDSTMVEILEKSQSFSEVLEPPPVSESSQSFNDDEILEDESEFTDDDEVSEEESENTEKIPRKGRMVISEEKDNEGVKLRFRRGKILDLQSESNGPRRLKFRKGKVIDGNGDRKEITKRNLEKKNQKEKSESENGHESVVLKHQGEQGKKDSQGLFNNVIEETASKLVESRKSKVKALVGAFETVISLQDGKP